jgi:hypothetical protein
MKTSMTYRKEFIDRLQRKHQKRVMAMRERAQQRKIRASLSSLGYR